MRAHRQDHASWRWQRQRQRRLGEVPVPSVNVFGDHQAASWTSFGRFQSRPGGAHLDSPNFEGRAFLMFR